MYPRLWRATKSWPISIPISSKNFSTSTRSIRNAFWRLPYTRRGRAQRRPAQFPKFLCTKSGCARNSRCHVSCGLFCYRQLDLGFRRRNGLAFSPVVGNSHAHSCAPASEGKTASAKKSALFGHFPSAQRDHPRDRRGRLRARRRCRLGLGRLPAILPVVLQRGGSRPGRDLPERTARFFVLLFADFVAHQKRYGLDDMELSAFLWFEAHSSVPHQSTAAGSIVLAALSKSS